MLTSGARGREAARRFDLRRWLPNTYLEKTDRATMAGGLEARTPFLDPVVATSAEADGREFGKEELVAELHRRCPDVRLPDRKKGLAVPISLLMREGMQTDLDHSTRSTSSLLVQLYGDRCAGDLAARAKLSPTMAYRLAVLGRWEAHNDVSV
jgi:asparagine synthetase B (glutamine-hydrolysing)